MWQKIDTQSKKLAVIHMYDELGGTKKNLPSRESGVCRQCVQDQV